MRRMWNMLFTRMLVKKHDENVLVHKTILMDANLSRHYTDH